jgi:hypothetical protein
MDSLFRFISFGSLFYGFMVSSLPAINWQQLGGSYVSRPDGSRDVSHLYDWQVAKAELRFPDLNEGPIPPDAHHPGCLLPIAVKEWLKRLGIIVRRENGWRMCQKLSITCVVHQPCQEESFATSERLWYRKDIPPGEAAVLLIPLSRGQISFSTLADFSSGGLRNASWPNGFLKRLFPFGYRDEPGWFLTRISGADDNEPFVFASLVFCPRQKQFFVAIEIIPPVGAVLNDIQAVEDILEHFKDARHPWSRNPQPKVIELPPPSNRIIPSSPSNRQPPSESARQQQTRTEQESLATFACSSGPLTPELEQRFTLPPGTPFLGEDELAQIIAEVLLEDIETHGDPFLEEIFAGGLEEDPPPVDFPIPPDIVPHDLITPPNLPPVNKPPRPSTEPHLPPRPCEYGRPEEPSDHEENYLKNQGGFLETFNHNLFSPFGLQYKVWKIEQMRCPSCGHSVWDARGCIWGAFRLNAAQHRLTVKNFNDEVDRYNRELRQYKERLAAYNRKVKAWKDWVAWYNPQIDERNRRLRSEIARIEQEQRDWVERIKRKNQQWIDQVQQMRNQWNEQVVHHSQRWIEWAHQQGQQWVERIERVRQQRDEKIKQEYQKWAKQIESQRERWSHRPAQEQQKWIEQVQREKQQWHERIEQEQRQWNEHVAREVQQWAERTEHLKQQWLERHRRLIQQWNERAEQLARQWGDTDEHPDPQWYEHVQRECREWRNQPAREWQEWSDQLARESRQMQEQVERDRQQIRERTRQGRKEQAEQYLEDRAANLLGQAHAQAQYQVYQASLFPFLSTRPARPSSGSRPRAPSPPPMEKVCLQWENSINMNGHNDKFRTVIRRTLRNTLGFEQGRAQELAEKADYWVHNAVIVATCKMAQKENYRGAALGGLAMAVDPIGTYRTARYYYFSKKGIKETIMNKIENFFFERLRKSKIWKNEKWLWDVQ